MALAALRQPETAFTPADLTDLEAALHESLERFEALSKAWPKGRDPLSRARIGKQHEDALSEIGVLRDQIASVPARSLADVAVKLRRLLVVVEGPEAEILLATALDGLEAQG